MAIRTRNWIKRIYIRIVSIKTVYEYIRRKKPGQALILNRDWKSERCSNLDLISTSDIVTLLKQSRSQFVRKCGFVTKKNKKTFGGMWVWFWRGSSFILVFSVKLTFSRSPKTLHIFVPFHSFGMILKRGYLRRNEGLGFLTICGGQLMYLLYEEEKVTQKDE